MNGMAIGNKIPFSSVEKFNKNILVNGPIK